MRLLNAILSFFFPSRCLSCDKYGEDFCVSCLSSLGPAERECPKWIYPLFDYRHKGMKKAVWFLKYKGRKNLARVFAEAMYGRILEELSDLSIMENFTEPLLIPIPLSPRRYRERGFNQAELISKEIIQLDGKQNFELVSHVLVKPHDTKHQAHVENRAERLKNLRGSFTLKNSEQIKGRNIILIDDVITTGATLGEARKILLEAGARKVIAFTLAH